MTIAIIYCKHEIVYLYCRNWQFYNLTGSKKVLQHFDQLIQTILQFIVTLFY